MKFIGISNIEELVAKHGINPFFVDVCKALEEDFKQWPAFEKKPRDASHFEDGVIELMPTFKDDLYSFKYVNGHPANTAKNRLCVFAFGCLSSTQTGYPVMISEMTILTAVRTACTAAVSSKYMARRESKTLTIIGTGAQSEFLVMAHLTAFDLEMIRYYDTDSGAMQRFEKNLKSIVSEKLTLTPCEDVEQAVDGADIIITCTADKTRAKVLMDEWVREGTHIIGLGGDCPGKTEIDKNLLKRSKIVVEYYPQTRVEGEIQVFNEEEQKSLIYAELWDIVSGTKPGRMNQKDITFFDSVGFAIEDFSILRLVNVLTDKYNIGQKIDLIPKMQDPKNLFHYLMP